MPLAGQALLAWGKTEPRCAFRENALCVPFMCPMFPYVFLFGEDACLCVLKKYTGQSKRKCCGGSFHVKEWYINWMSTLRRCKLTQWLCTSEEQEYHVRMPSKRNEHWLHLWDFSGPLAGSRQLRPGAKPHNGDREDALYKLPTTTSFWKTRYWLDPWRLLNRF